MRQLYPAFAVEPATAAEALLIPSSSKACILTGGTDSVDWAYVIPFSKSSTWFVTTLLHRNLVDPAFSYRVKESRHNIIPRMCLVLSVAHIYILLLSLSSTDVFRPPSCTTLAYCTVQSTYHVLFDTNELCVFLKPDTLRQFVRIEEAHIAQRQRLHKAGQPDPGRPPYYFTEVKERFRSSAGHEMGIIASLRPFVTPSLSQTTYPYDLYLDGNLFGMHIVRFDPSDGKLTAYGPTDCHRGIPTSTAFPELDLAISPPISVYGCLPRLVNIDPITDYQSEAIALAVWLKQLWSWDAGNSLLKTSRPNEHLPPADGLFEDPPSDPSPPGPPSPQPPPATSVASSSGKRPRSPEEDQPRKRTVLDHADVTRAPRTPAATVKTISMRSFAHETSEEARVEVWRQSVVKGGSPIWHQPAKW